MDLPQVRQAAPGWRHVGKTNRTGPRRNDANSRLRRGRRPSASGRCQHSGHYLSGGSLEHVDSSSELFPMGKDRPRLTPSRAAGSFAPGWCRRLRVPVLGKSVGQRPSAETWGGEPSTLTVKSRRLVPLRPTGQLGPMKQPSGRSSIIGIRRVGVPPGRCFAKYHHQWANRRADIK